MGAELSRFGGVTTLAAKALADVVGLGKLHSVCLSCIPAFYVEEFYLLLKVAPILFLLVKPLTLSFHIFL